ncbi:MAG: CocE/NonD family hydrolase [Opitutales bacterium]
MSHIGRGFDQPPFHGVDFESGVMLELPDGCRLAADVYTPSAPGAYPVLLMRQPYGRDIASTVVYAHPTYFARQGYIVVIQDVRGRGGSDGAFYAFRNEEADGEATVHWAAGLPKSNGRVGMYGFSYQGSTQLLAALRKPEPLRALAPHMTAFDLYSGWFYRSGILQLATTTSWGNQMLREDARRAGAREAYRALEASWGSPGTLNRRFPLNRIAEFQDEALPAYARDWLTHPDKDGYWAAFDLLRRVNDLALPMYHIGGWYDFYARGTVDGYTAMRETRAARDQLLVAGPWVHIPWGNRVGPGDFSTAARLDTDALLVAFMDRHLKERPPDPALGPVTGARYFSLGENRWVTSTVWPPPEAETRTVYLASRGRANSRFGDGRLDPEAATGPEDLFNYDPEVPVVAPGGNHGGATGFGPFDQAAMQQGNNLLVYTAEPGLSRVSMAGRPSCTLFVASTAPDTDFVVRLTHVTPAGKARFLTLGAAPLRQGSPGPGGSVRLEIALDPIAFCLETGDQLRLDVASSAYPLLARNPNTGTSALAVEGPEQFQRALQVIYHDAQRPSCLHLPILPAGV